MCADHSKFDPEQNRRITTGQSTTGLLNVALPDGPVTIGTFTVRPPREDERKSLFFGDDGFQNIAHWGHPRAVIERTISLGQREMEMQLQIDDSDKPEIVYEYVVLEDEPNDEDFLNFLRLAFDTDSIRKIRTYQFVSDSVRISSPERLYSRADEHLSRYAQRRYRLLLYFGNCCERTLRKFTGGDGAWLTSVMMNRTRSSTIGLASSRCSAKRSPEVLPKYFAGSLQIALEIPTLKGSKSFLCAGKLMIFAATSFMGGLILQIGSLTNMRAYVNI